MGLLKLEIYLQIKLNYTKTNVTQGNDDICSFFLSYSWRFNPRYLSSILILMLLKIFDLIMVYQFSENSILNSKQLIIQHNSVCNSFLWQFETKALLFNYLSYNKTIFYPTNNHHVTNIKRLICLLVLIAQEKI